MKIAFTGASSTGKTTLAHAVASKLALPVLTRRSRSVAELMGIGDLNNVEPTKRALYQHAILLSQIGHELRHEDKYIDGYVTDRSVVDILMYWMLDNQENFSSLNSIYWQSILQYKKYHKYDLLVYVPIEFEGQEDGFRYTGEHRKKEDEFIADFIKHHDNFLFVAEKIITVTGSVEQRYGQIIQTIKRR